MIPLHVNSLMTPVSEVYIHDSWKSKAKNDNYINDLKDVRMVNFLIMPISWRRVITVQVCSKSNDIERKKYIRSRLNIVTTTTTISRIKH